MKLLSQMALVCSLYLLGELISSLLPIPIPGSVIGMAILLILLLSHKIREEKLQTFSDYILGNLSFFFIPSGVAIMNNFDYIKNDFLVIIFICVITTVITFYVTAYTVKFISVLLYSKTKGEEICR